MKLEIGYKNTFEIRNKNLNLGLDNELKIIFISDLHLNGYSETLVYKLIQTVGSQKPDLILLGGDYVDTKKGLYLFEKLCSLLPKNVNKVAIWGNHDRFFGIKRIHPILEKNSIKLIDQDSIQIESSHKKILVSNSFLPDPTTHFDLSIAIVHNPKKLKNLNSSFNLALAGHLHGCQLVLKEKDNKLYPGIWFYPWNFLETQIKNVPLLISKGLGDTLPIRYNCPRDIIIITIN